MKSRGRRPSLKTKLALIGLEPGKVKPLRCKRCGREWCRPGLLSSDKERRERREWWICPMGCNRAEGQSSVYPR